MKNKHEMIDRLRECQEIIKVLADDIEKEQILERANTKPRTVLQSLTEDLGINISKFAPETLTMIEEKYSVKLKLKL